MKSEHRHELKTNELAEWISNLPKWAQKNRTRIIYISVVVVLVAGSYFYHSYQKNVVSVQKKLEFSNILSQLPHSKMQVIRDQASGFDSSYNFLQFAESLQTTAQNIKDKHPAALALIKQAEVLRTELHYRLGPVTRQDLEAAINRAKAAYTEAVQKSATNPSLTAMAEFGLGLCEEELGNFDQAEQIYSNIIANPGFEGTTAVAQAQLRLKTIADYKQKVFFKTTAPKIPAELTQPQLSLELPDQNAVSRTKSDIPEIIDINLAGK